MTALNGFAAAGFVLVGPAGADPATNPDAFVRYRVVDVQGDGTTATIVPADFDPALLLTVYGEPSGEPLDEPDAVDLPDGWVDVGHTSDDTEAVPTGALA